MKYSRFTFNMPGEKPGFVKSDKQTAIFHAAATGILMPVKGGYELSLERIEVSKPEGSIHIPVQVLLYDLKIGLIIDSHNYNIDVTSSISSAVKMPERSTLPPPPVVPVSLHTPLFVH